MNCLTYSSDNDNEESTAKSTNTTVFFILASKTTLAEATGLKVMKENDVYPFYSSRTEKASVLNMLVSAVLSIVPSNS